MCLVTCFWKQSKPSTVDEIGDNHKIEVMEYRAIGAVVKERRVQINVESFREHLRSMRTDVNWCDQRLSLYIERYSVDDTDGFSGSLYSWRTEAKI